MRSSADNRNQESWMVVWEHNECLMEAAKLLSDKSVFKEAKFNVTRCLETLKIEALLQIKNWSVLLLIINEYVTRIVLPS